MAIASVRKDKVSVLTVDRVLADDIRQRLEEDPRWEHQTLAAPQTEDALAAVEEVERLAEQSGSARVVILDVRSQTLPWLQKAFNLAAGLNRKDLNRTCHNLLIGDGPPMLFQPGHSADVFVAHLAKFRNDYWPAAYFYDPFLHYAFDELGHERFDVRRHLWTHVPARLARAFEEETPQVEDVRRYFRAASLSGRQRRQVQAQRQEQLLRIFRKRLRAAFPDRQEQMDDMFTHGGYYLGAETVRLHTYPFFFEDWVFELLSRAR